MERRILKNPLTSIVRQLQSDRLEYSKVFFLFGYLFCVVSAATVGRTAADTLFLSAYDASVLSYMYLPQAIILILVGIVYQKLCSRFRTDVIVIAVIISAGLLALVSRLLIAIGINGILPFIYIGFDVLNFLMIVCFWQFATAVLDQRKAKRTIGWVGSGGIVGGILSGFGLKALAQPIGTENLIYVYAGFQLLSLFFVMCIYVKISDRNEAFAVKIAPKSADKRIERSKEAKKGLFQSVPHLRYVAIVAATITISLTLIDYQFKTILRSSLQNEALAGFMGSFYGYAGLLALLVQLFISGKMITRFGVTTAILVFPIVLLSGSVLLLIVPILAIATMVKGSDKVLGDTIYSSVNQLIMFPIPPEWRGKAKAFIDGIARNGAKGVAAVGLILLSQYISIEQFSYIILGLMICCVIAAIKIKKTYLALLLSTLQSKDMNIEGEHVNLMDPASIQIMVDALRGNDPQQALYAFQFLQSVDGFDMAPYFEPLLKHPSEQIRIEMLKYIQAETPRSAEHLLESLLESVDINVRSSAILAVAAYAKEPHQERMIQLLKDKDIHIRSVSIAGLIKYYGIEGMFHAVGSLKEMMGSIREDEREAMAAIFGLIGIARFYKPLIPMLSDASEQVKISALHSAKLLTIPELIPHIVPLLKDSTTRQQAIEALAVYNEADILRVLTPYMYSEDNHHHIPLVIERFASQTAFDALLERYEHLTTDMRDKVLESVTRMKDNLCFIQPVYGERLITGEIETFWAYVEHSEQIPKVNELAWINKEMDEIKVRQIRTIFQLLAIVYDTQTINRVYVNWATGDVRQQANAAEAIDQLLNGKLRTEMVKIMDYKAPIHNEQSDSIVINEQLEWLYRQGDSWLRCLIDQVRNVETDQSTEAEPLERVRLLSHVSLFAGLSSKDLFKISQLLEVVNVSKDAPIIKEMELGDSLYLIKQGSVGIYRNGSKIGKLSTSDCFGEMAVITQGHRTATIVAEEDTQLYQLTSQAFFNGLFERTEIAREMMKILSRRLRSMNANIESSDAVHSIQHEVAAAKHREPHDVDELETMSDQAKNAKIVKRVLTLQRIGLFANFSQKDLIQLASLVNEREYGVGEIICRIGDYGDTMYGIVEGQIQIHKGSEILATLGVGQCFGEMTLIDGEPRSADCTVNVPTVLLELTREQVMSFCFQRIDVLKAIIHVLAERCLDTQQRT
ncbi:MAG: Npt1/Npt2 family nucleotide transporter [Candidatus Cohnella colombiensis]|uniref:ADP,ATP carrier protein n=1 Tax=Candidatus Cohnella colombiensis TaxID=3121368 RepID=A0AA95EY93_9BACL|nr:MAG: Npt1/Npt2 family nucleotide transporter [Cohnella sp.]